MKSTYHSLYAWAITEAKNDAKSRGYEFNFEQIFQDVSLNCCKPSEGQTTRVLIDLYKNGTLQREVLNLQVYNRGNKYHHRYESNYYIA